MRHCRWMLLVVPFITVVVLPVNGQGILLIPADYGYGGYGYSRYRGPVGVRIGVVGSPYAFAPNGYSVTRIKVITIVPPPERSMRRSSLDEDPPGELPDIPVPRIRRDPPPRVDPPKKDPAPRPPEVKVPLDDPRAESERQVRLGKEAFNAEEDGRAVLRFREAIRLRPDEAMPYFLLAQALVALGKYHQAHDAILAGMAKSPDWPRARFRPIDLYGERFAEYPEHLLRLDTALKKHPNDPILLFLNAYQVWFAGRKDDAAPLFRKALERLAGKPGVEDLRKACERFLREV